MVNYLYCLGALVFIEEWGDGSSKKFALLIAIIYPLTICLGAIGWVVFAIYKLYKWIS